MLRVQAGLEVTADSGQLDIVVWNSFHLSLIHIHIHTHTDIHLIITITNSKRGEFGYVYYPINTLCSHYLLSTSLVTSCS